MINPSQRSSDGSVDRVFVAVIACFVLSGFAALLYQTVWMREFSILFGTSELAIATVLAAYMGGLALGAAVAGRWVRRVRRPVLFYGLLELGVAVGALLVPVGLWLAQQLMVALIGGQEELGDSGGVGKSIFYLLFGFVILAIPTAFMGATLPVLTRYVVHSEDQIGRRTGLLYAMNTAGAVLGTLSCAFLLLPALGLFATTLVGVGVNALVFVIAIRLDPQSDEPVTEEAPVVERERVSPFVGRGWILPLIAASGAIAFAYEVLWTRLLAHILGTSVYSFATMLATFLTGITLGSAVAARLARDVKRSSLGFFIVQGGTAISALFVFAMLDRVPSIAASLSAGEQAGLAANAFVSALVLFPTTFFIGATFPFAVRILARSEDEAAPASARVYAWNTVGAIVGAVLSGFVIIPTLEFTGTVVLAVLANLAIGIACAVWISELAPKVWLGLAGGVVVILLLIFPSSPERLLSMSPVDDGTTGRVIYSAVGQSATVLLMEHSGNFYLRTNGLPEALIAPKGAPPIGQQGNWWLGALPPLAHPDAKSMLIIGLGGGVIIEGVPNSIERIDVIELEPKVEAANRVISDRRQTDPLADPRVRIIYNDARGALALTNKRWDIIVSQPSHPWTAGASHLYTREFMEQIRGHLNEGGLFCQGYLDESILGMVGRTLNETFTHTRLYCPGSYLYLAADREIELIAPDSRSQEVIERDPRHYAWLGVHGRIDLAPALVLTREGIEAFSAESPVITDDRNALATAPPHLVQAQRSPDARSPRLDELDPLQATGPENVIERYGLPGPYLARRVAGIGFPTRAKKIAESLRDPGDRALALELLSPAPSPPERLEQWLLEYPEHTELRYHCLSRLAQVRAPTDAELAPLAPAARAVLEVIRVGPTAGEEMWKRIASLDGALATAEGHQLAYERATYFRSAWRTAFASPSSSGPPDEKRALAREALALIDDVVAMYPQDHYYLQRMSAAVLAGEPHVVVETASAIADFLAKAWRGLPPQRRESTAAQTIGRLDQAEKLPDAPLERLQEVRRRLRGMSGK